MRHQSPLPSSRATRLAVSNHSTAAEPETICANTAIATGRLVELLPSTSALPGDGDGPCTGPDDQINTGSPRVQQAGWLDARRPVSHYRPSPEVIPLSAAVVAARKRGRSQSTGPSGACVGGTPPGTPEAGSARKPPGFPAAHLRWPSARGSRLRMFGGLWPPSGWCYWKAEFAKLGLEV
jgi:hypothetical protein